MIVKVLKMSTFLLALLLVIINGKAFLAPFCTALVPPLFTSNNLRLHFWQMNARLPRVLDNDGR